MLSRVQGLIFAIETIKAIILYSIFLIIGQVLKDKMRLEKKQRLDSFIHPKLNSKDYQKYKKLRGES